MTDIARNALRESAIAFGEAARKSDTKPFGATVHIMQKGLSQFDAPEGSLLAFATAPGSVAADGLGSNGRYTENLVRELSVKGVRLEGALKRVRLAVRLASQGAQIPWESTSLESDVFLFPSGDKLSEAELVAVTSPRRALAWPDIPTVAESGFPGFDVLSWVGVLAPAGTPLEIIDRLHREIVRILNIPEVRNMFLAQSAEPVGNTPEQFAAEIRSSIARWAPVVSAAGIRPDN